MTNRSSAPDLLSHYSFAKERVLAGGYEAELTWVQKLDEKSFSETDLIREAAWVILCSGFRESVVRAKFSYISLCFCDWESADLIASNKEACVNLAEKAFKYRRKLDAIAAIATEVASCGFAQIRLEIYRDPQGRLIRFPFIGPITSYHLAKNLGFQFAKDDRHLQRLVKLFGYPDAQVLCAAIALETGDSIATVDTVLWRNAALISAFL